MAISIIIPVYNVSAYIERCIHSLINQTWNDFEIILVDDCGTDDSIRKASDLLQTTKLNYKIVKRTQNGGLSAARNTGIQHATGDYLFFVDSDDELPINAVEIINERLSLDDSCQALYFNAEYWGTHDTKFSHMLNIEAPAKIASQDFLLRLFSGSYLSYIWMYVFKKSIFENVQFPEGAVYEDALTLPYILNLITFVNVDLTQTIYYYYVREGSISRSFHPQLKEVIPAFNVMEQKLYKDIDNPTYSGFVYFRTTYIMRLSREAFTRSANKKDAIALHSYWGAYIPKRNITTLWKTGKKKSAVFLYLLKFYPSLISFFYKINLLK